MRIGVLVVVAAAWSTAVGCNNTVRQKELALNGMEALRDAYNRGSCSEIYDSAGERFIRSQSREGWMSACEGVRRESGQWREFNSGMFTTWPVGSVGIVVVEGMARFDRKACHLRTDWSIERGRARLYNFLLKCDGREISLPGFNP